MNFRKFADLMEKIGFRDHERIEPIFTLNRGDLKNYVFRNSYAKVAGHYRVTSLWSQGGEVAFWARECGDANKIYPFFKEEIDFLTKNGKFRKN